MRSDPVIWYARIAVFLPLLVPGCVYLFHLVGLVGPSFSLGASLGSILLSGIPYAAFAVVGLVRSRSPDLGELQPAGPAMQQLGTQRLAASGERPR